MTREKGERLVVHRDSEILREIPRDRERGFLPN